MKGLLLDNVGLNCTDATDIERINVGGQETGSAKRRFAFEINDVYYKINVENNVGTLAQLPTQSITVDSILEEGNTASELAEVTSCPQLAGNIVYSVIALYGEYGSLLPTASLSFSKKTAKDIYVYTDQSPVFELTKDESEAKIISITADKDIKGNASLDVSVSLYKDGAWTEYMSLPDSGGQTASKVKFKSLFRVRTFDGSDKATLNKVSIVYSSNRAPVTGNSSELISITRNYESDIGFASLLVKHKAMNDSHMDAYAALRKNTKKREDIVIGSGTGGKQTFTLGVADESGSVVADENIDHNSLVIKVNNVEVNEFDFNMSRGHITVYADLGATVTASYEYGLGVEDWRKMNKVIVQPYNGQYDILATKFELPVNDSGNTITAIRLVLTRDTGTVTDAFLGYATGQAQTIILKNFARKDTIVSNVDFTYNDITKEFSFIADQGTPVNISYEWTGETQEIYSIAPFWTYSPEVFNDELATVPGGADEAPISTTSVEISRIKQQVIYTQGYLAELSAQLDRLEAQGNND